MQQRFFLKPDRTTTQLVLGCFARALQRYPDLELYVLQVLSNHGSFLATPSSAPVLSDFMRDFKADLGRKLNDKYDRQGAVWERRYRAIPVVDEQSMDDRFRYILTQGTKENLVWRASDWPGVTSISALLGRRPLVGRWRDRGLEYERKRQRRRKIERAAKRGELLELPATQEYWSEFEIPLQPMPHWRQFTIRQRHARISSMLSADDRETRARHHRNGTRPIGVERILETDAFQRPDAPKKSAAPLCHAATGRVRRAFLRVYRLYRDVIRSSAERLHAIARALGVPNGAITPPLFHDPHRPRRRRPTIRPPDQIFLSALGASPLASSVSFSSAVGRS